MLDILPQLLVFSLLSASIYALISAGLTLTFGTLEFINFAHGEMAMAGAYSFFSFYVLMGLSIPLSLILTAIVMLAIGLIIERSTFRPVRDKQPFIPLVLSIGVSIIFQSAATMIYGGGSQTYYKASQVSTSYKFLDGSLIITQAQVLIILTAVVLLLSTYLFLKYSRTGKSIRAVSDDREIAAIMGIDVNKTISILFGLATMLAGIGGVLVAFDQNLFPLMGLMLSIKAFAVVVIAGVGHFKGVIWGALIIGLSENLITGLTPISSSYKDLIVFVIFITILLFKPYGLFGGKKEEAESR
jgi:branched-chain amino acid transport system permease protein